MEVNMNNNYYDQEELWNRELTLQETERIDIVKKFIQIGRASCRERV